MKNLTFLLFALAIVLQINAADINKQLFKAIKKGDIEQVKQLVEDGVDVNCRNRKGFSPLHIAVASNYVNIMHILIEQGADLSYQCENCSNVTLLGVASFNRAYAAAEYLLEKGVNVNGAAGQKETPLISATMDDDIKMMKLLLEHGADVNLLDKSGRNALWYIRCKEAFDLVYNAGINLHTIDKEGNSALIALWYEKFEGINEVLCTMFYEGAIFHEPKKDHYIYYHKNFGKPVSFDSLLILDNIDLVLELWKTDRETLKFKTTNDSLIIAQKENEYHFGINGGIPDGFEMEADEDVLSICISRFAKNKAKYNGITDNYFSPLPLEQENAWAHIKHKGENYYAFMNKDSGYVIIADERCSKVKFFNLLLENPETGKKLRIYGENNCLNE